MVTRTGTCTECKASFFYTAPSTRGKGRVTCDACRADRNRDKTRERVANMRKRIADSQKDKPVLIVHIRSCNGKTYCGLQHDATVARNIAIERRKGIIDTRLCKTCERAFMADTEAVPF